MTGKLRLLRLSDAFYDETCRISNTETLFTMFQRFYIVLLCRYGVLQHQHFKGCPFLQIKIFILNIITQELHKLKDNIVIYMHYP